MTSIARTTDLPLARLAELIAESEASGLQMLCRLEQEWTNGENRFDRPGEALFLASDEHTIFGVCGLNRDPYTSDPSIGRVRHLYVLASERRKGIGRDLIQTVVETARASFHCLRLRTGNPEAAAFYQALGFVCCDEPNCTHRLDVVPFLLTAHWKPTNAQHSANPSRW